MRGVAAGLLTAALAVAAHGVGGGGVPPGATTALLAVLAATVGASATTAPRAGRPSALFGLLAGGQLLGHLVLSAAGHHHAESSAPPAAAMLAAHLLAIVVGAALITTGDTAVACAVSCSARDGPHDLSGGGAARARRASGRPATAFSASACRFGVASGSAGQPRPLTDHPHDTRKPQTNEIHFPGVLARPAGAA